MYKTNSILHIFFSHPFYHKFEKSTVFFKIFFTFINCNNKCRTFCNFITKSATLNFTIYKKKNNVEVVILTSDKSNIENLDVKKFNKE